MDNYSKIYWLTRLDNLQAFFITAFVISLVVLFVYHLVMIIDCYDNDDRKEYKINWGKYRTISFWLALVMGVFLVFMPTKNDMILIYAGGKTMDYVQSDTSLAKIPYQTTTIISEYLDKSIKELKDKK
jgi:hypothetical protein